MLGRIAVVFIFLSSTPTLAADPPPDPSSPSIAAQQGAPMPANVTDLDAALATNDYDTLNRAHAAITDANALFLFMNWEQVRSFGGEGGFYLSTRYMSDLWEVGSAMAAQGQQEQGGGDLRQTAVFMGLYSYELLVLDGTKCVDSTASGHRMDQLATSPVWGFAHTIDDAQREKMLDYVVKLESLTASKRGNDQALCQGGMLDIMQSLLAMAKQGKAPQEVPTPPGQIGRTYELSPAGGETQFLDPKIWQPEQEKLRAGMRARLEDLLKPPASH
jgi:hypothetical protein